MVKIDIPSELRPFTGGNSEVEGEGRDVGDLIAGLDRVYPGLRDRLLDGKGNLRRHVAVFLDDEDIRSLDGLETRLKDGQRLLILPAIAGG